MNLGINFKEKGKSQLLDVSLVWIISFTMSQGQPVHAQTNAQAHAEPGQERRPQQPHQQGLLQLEMKTVEASTTKNGLAQSQNALKGLNVDLERNTQIVVVMPGVGETQASQAVPTPLVPLVRGFTRAKYVTVRLSAALSEALRNYSELHPWRLTIANLRFAGISAGISQIVFIQYGLGPEVSAIGGLTAGLMSWALMLNLDWETRFLNKQGWWRQSLKDARITETAAKWYFLEVVYAGIVTGVVLGAGYLLAPAAFSNLAIEPLKLAMDVLLAAGQGMLAQGTLERFITYLRQKKQEKLLLEEGLPIDLDMRAVFEIKETHRPLYRRMSQVRLTTMVAIGIVSTLMTSFTVGAAIGMTELNYLLGVSGVVGFGANFYLHWDGFKKKFRVRVPPPTDFRLAPSLAASESSHAAPKGRSQRTCSFVFSSSY